MVTGADVVIDVDVDVDATSVLLMLSRANEGVSMAHIAQAFDDDGPVVEMLHRQVAERFADEGDNASGKWAPLSPATLDIKERLGYGGNPANVRTGRMREWLLNDGGDLDMMGDGMFFTYPGDVPGGMADRFETAQFGSAETGAPPRPVIAADGDDLMSIMEIVGNWVYDFMGADVTGMAS